jgi:hypothetical protein
MEQPCGAHTEAIENLKRETTDHDSLNDDEWWHCEFTYFRRYDIQVFR